MAGKTKELREKQISELCPVFMSGSKKALFALRLLILLLALVPAVGIVSGAVAFAAAGEKAVYKVRDFGATGNGSTLDSPAINAAISACSKNGGGVVRLTPGTYRCGTIRLLDDIALQLDAGAVILGSAELSDYAKMERSSEHRDTALIIAENVRNIAIRGKGTIDGNGKSFIDPSGPRWTPSFDGALTRQGQDYVRRMAEAREGPAIMKTRPGVLMVLLHVNGLELRDFHVVDTPNWAIKIGGSKHITVRNLDVRSSLLIPNNDSLDISNSQDATISDCYLESGDDALVIGGPCLDGWCQEKTERIRVSNVTLVSRSAAIRVGCCAKGVRDVSFSKIVIKDSNRGILIQARSEESIEDLVFDGVKIQTRLIDGPWWGAGEPIAISVAYWDYVSWPKATKRGLLRHLRFNNITADCQAPVVIYGMEPGHIQDLSFRKLSLNLKSGPLLPLLGGNLDLQPNSPPLEFGVKKQDLPAILAYNADQLSFSGLRVNWKGDFPDFYTSALAADGFRDLKIEDFRGGAARGDLPAIDLRNGAGVIIKKAGATKGKLLEQTRVQDIRQ